MSSTEVVERGRVGTLPGQLPRVQAISPRRMVLGDAISLYKSVGRRNTVYFDWLHKVYSWICLPCVSANWKEVLSEDKTKMAIFDILVDDLADNSNTRSQSLLDEFIRIPWHDVSESHEYLTVGRKIWEDYITSVRTYPRFKDFERLFYFDIHQVLSSMVYSSFVNAFELDNPIETSFYSSYGCMVILAMDMDLMCSPSFDLKELGIMRAVSCLAQKVAHIGNMLNTYQGEVLEKDLSCPLVTLAIRKGLIKREELGTEAVLAKISLLEPVYKSRALSCIHKVRAYEAEIRSVDIRGFAEHLTELLDRFGSSRPLR